MLKRVLSGALGAMQALNGALMLIDGRRWYDTVPGVTMTGPYNPHFVADIGAAFLAAGLALAARAWRVRYWPAALAGSAFLVLHALIHVLGLLQGHTHTAAFDIALIIIPALIALWTSFPNQGDLHA